MEISRLQKKELLLGKKKKETITVKQTKVSPTWIGHKTLKKKNECRNTCTSARTV